MHISVSELSKLVNDAEELLKNGEWSWNDATVPMFIGNGNNLRNLNPQWVARQSLVSGKSVFGVILRAAENINRMRDILRGVFDVRKDRSLSFAPHCERDHVGISSLPVSCYSSSQETEDHRMEIDAAWQAPNKLIESHQNNAESSERKQAHKGYWAKIVNLMASYPKDTNSCDENQKKAQLDLSCSLSGALHNVPILRLSDNWDIEKINNLLAKQNANFRIRAKVEKKFPEATPADQPSLRNMVEAQPPLVIFGATGHEINLKWIQWYIMTTQCSKESAFFTAKSILKQLANN